MEAPYESITCKQGHSYVPRVRPNGKRYGCLTCQKARAKLWHQENREHVAVRLKTWRQKNRERFNGNQRSYYARNRERVNGYALQWSLKNRKRILQRRAELHRQDRVPYIWRGIIKRCTVPSTAGYGDYGGRGISVCERWTGEDGLRNFRLDMGEPPTSRHSINREDVNGDYTPSNCQWATPKEQARNKRTTLTVELDGKIQSVCEWADEVGIPYKIIYRRLTVLRWPVDRALTQTPSKIWSKHTEMCRRAMSWLLGEIGCDVAVENGFISLRSERPDAIGWSDAGSYLVECKIGRCDFRADWRKRTSMNPSSGVGRVRYYLCAPGLIRPNELPEGWGLLHCGDTITIVKKATPFKGWNKEGESKLLEIASRNLRLERRQSAQPT